MRFDAFEAKKKSEHARKPEANDAPRQTLGSCVCVCVCGSRAELFISAEFTKHNEETFAGPCSPLRDNTCRRLHIRGLFQLLQGGSSQLALLILQVSPVRLLRGAEQSEHI